jgi:hypothetical protein
MEQRRVLRENVETSSQFEDEQTSRGEFNALYHFIVLVLFCIALFFPIID